MAWVFIPTASNPYQLLADQTQFLMAYHFLQAFSEHPRFFVFSNVPVLYKFLYFFKANVFPSTPLSLSFAFGKERLL